MQAFVAPQATDPFVVDLPARLAGSLGGSPPPPPRPLIGERSEELAQKPIVVSDLGWIKSLGGAVLADHSAGPTF